MLKNTQKKHLKSLAHNKKPIVIIGNNGLTSAVLEEIDKALLFHELIKVKINAEERAERDVIIQKIKSELLAELVQRVGHVAIFFRRNPETSRITLPA
jgi:RNA-binding protein